MVNEDHAEATFQKARAFYKCGHKSSNKSYYGTGPTSDKGLFGGPTFKIDLEPDAKPDVSQQARNRTVLENLQTMYNDGRKASNNTGKTPFGIGQELVNQGNTRGNCGEMAAVALYFAVADVHIAADEVSLCSLTNTVGGGLFSNDRSFGHSFAVLGKGARTDGWAIDPWAGAWCPLSDYAKTLTAKLEYWTKVGKRIPVNLPNGHCWVEPTNAMVTGILAKEAAFREIGANQPGS